MASWTSRNGRVALVTCCLTLMMGTVSPSVAWADPATSPSVPRVVPTSDVPSTAVPTLGAPQGAIPVVRPADPEAPPASGGASPTPRPTATQPAAEPVMIRMSHKAPRRPARPRLASRSGRALLLTQPRPASPSQESLRDVSPLILKYARQYNLDPRLVRAVIEVESQYRNYAVSRCGARGLMQLMPGTGRSMGARDLHDPEQNIAAGTRYLRAMLDRYSGRVESAVAAYNAGPGNVSLGGGIPNISETRRYVWKVFRAYQKFVEAPTPVALPSAPAVAPATPSSADPSAPSAAPPADPAPTTSAPGAPRS